MTENQKEKIKQMWECGAGYTLIANELCLSKDNVKAFCRTHNLGGKMAIYRKPKESENRCQCCGKPVLQIPSRKVKKFCSDKCRMVWWNSHPELVKRKNMSHLVCAVCGSSFDSKNPHQKYCSRKCYGVSRKAVSDG